MEKLIIALRKYGALSDELIERLSGMVRTKRYKKGAFLLKEGMVDHHVWFIESGLLVIYQNGDEKILVTWILEADDFVIATDSFESHEPTKDNILAEEETVAWFINREELIATCRNFPEFFEIYTAIHGAYRKK